MGSTSSIVRGRSRKLILAAVLIFTAIAVRADVVIKDGATSSQLKVDANGNALVANGQSTRATYKCTATGLATTALYNMSIEAGASKGFKLLSWCVGVSPATAAAAVTVTVQRRTTASTGGTPAAAEGTASPAVSKLDPSDGAFGGICRITSTLGTAGAIIDGVGLVVGEIGAGTADVSGPAPFCKFYSFIDGKVPSVSAGTANGLSINVSAPGAGGLAAGSITATFIEE